MQMPCLSVNITLEEALTTAEIFRNIISTTLIQVRVIDLSESSQRLEMQK